MDEVTPRTVNIVCAKAPRHIATVPAIRKSFGFAGENVKPDEWRCSFCGARVKVVAP